jgi:hypothetical protein
MRAGVRGATAVPKQLPVTSVGIHTPVLERHLRQFPNGNDTTENDDQGRNDMKFQTRIHRWRLRNVALGLAIAAIAAPSAAAIGAGPNERPDGTPYHAAAQISETQTTQFPSLEQLQQFSFDSSTPTLVPVPTTLPNGDPLPGDDGLKSVPTEVPASYPVPGDDGYKFVPVTTPQSAQPLYPVDAPRSGPASVDIPQASPLVRVPPTRVAPVAVPTRIAPPQADVNAKPVSTPVSTPGFDWGDAGIGMALGLCLALLLTAAWFIVGRKPGQPASA